MIKPPALMRWYAAVALFICISFAGCGDGLQRAAVRGRVTLGDKPLAEGTVRFIAEGSSLAGIAAAEIVAGEYRLDEAHGPVIGRNRVEITSYQKTGSQHEVAPGKWRDVYEQAVPERYNVESRESVDVAAGENEFNFPLESR